MTAGLGLSENNIGRVLASSGVLFAMFQYVVFRTINSKFGILLTMKIGLAVNIVSTVLIPVSSLLNGQKNKGEIPLPSFIFLTLVIAIQKIFSCMFFAAITIATNKTVPVEYRGTMNGFSMVGASLFKALGPIAFGFTLSYLISSGVVLPLLGSFLTFFFISSFGVILLIYLGVVSFD